MSLVLLVMISIVGYYSTIRDKGSVDSEPKQLQATVQDVNEEPNTAYLPPTEAPTEQMSESPVTDEIERPAGDPSSSEPTQAPSTIPVASEETT
jgi:hypothetical protein